MTLPCDIIAFVKTTRTVVLKLQPTADQTVELDATLAAFAKACDYIADVARQEHTTNKVLIQRVCYREVRATFGLSANLAIRAIARVCAALKVPEKVHSAFKPTSVDYDARIFSFREWDWTVSFKTSLNSRERIGTKPGEHQKNRAKGTTPTAAQLVKRDGRFFLHIQIGGEAPESIEPDDFLGVDLGIAKIATTSDEPKGHCGKPVEKVRRKHNLQRKRLQRKATKGAKEETGADVREGSPIPSPRESHCISKTIVQTAKDTGRGIALENLKGIRNRITARSGDARNRLSAWSFHQLVGFLFVQGRRTRESPSCRLILATPVRRVPSVGIANGATGKAKLSSPASTAGSPRTPIGTPPGTSGLWPQVRRPQNWARLIRDQTSGT